MLTTSGATTDTPDILVTLGRVFGKIDPSTKHATNVGVPLVEPIMNDVMDKGRP